MPRLPLASALVFALALPGVAKAQTGAPKPLSASQRQLVSRLTSEWQAYFRAISSLEMQWKTFGDSYLGDGTRDTYKYSYSGEPGRQRLDIAFLSSKTLPQNVKTSTHLEASSYVKNFDTLNAGFTRLTARPLTPETKNQLGAVIPLLEIFGWARDEKANLSLHAFSGDAMWQRFASRIETVEAGKWQGKRGWWLGFSQQRTPQSRRNTLVFVDRATLFPFCTTGHITFKSSEVNQERIYRIQVDKTQQVSVKGQPRLMPLEYSSREETRDIIAKTRKVQVLTTTLLAPPKINAPIEPQRWQLAVPSKTLVNYAPSIKTKMLDETPFYYDAKGGSLWAQNQHERERHESALRRFRAMPVIYDEKADGETQIAEALVLATAQKKGVLLQFGAWWCPPCHTLHDLLKSDSTLSPLVKDNYISVAIDVNNGHNESVSKRLSGNNQNGIPFLVVLDATGKRLATPSNEDFAPESGGDEFDIKKLTAFLNHWKTRP